MANEAVCIEPYTKVVRYTVIDGTAIAKGTLLKVTTDPNTASATSADADSFAGIAIEEKVISDGITEIGCAVDGTWDLVAGTGAIICGNLVAISGANLIRVAEAKDFVSGSFVGKALETASASERIRVRIGVI